MIIKRTMKTEMPNLKRCNLEDPDSEDYRCLAIQKKRKVNGFYSLGMPGDAEDLSSGSGSWCSEGSYWGGGEVRSNSNSRQLNSRTALDRGSEGLRPPLLRSSRGRPQLLPSRFNDSVLDTWKNRGIKMEDTDSSFEDDNVNNTSVEDRVGIGGTGFLKHEKRDSYGLKNPGCYPCPEMKLETDLGGVGFNDFDKRKGVNSFGTVRTTVNGSGSSVVKTESNTSGLDQKPNGNAEKKKDIYKPEDFALGDIVWAKCGKRYPAWPAVVIDPILQAPKSVLSCCVSGAICVMFYGYSKNGKQRDYAWVKQGMIFPFLECMDRFQGQTQLYKSKPSDFRMALEEAMLAEDGILDSHLGAEQVTNVEAHPNGLIEATGSYVDRGYYCQDQGTTRSCAGCGLMLSWKTMKKIKDSSYAPQLYCKHCAKLQKSKQYCGICKKIWHHSDGGNWVRLSAF